MNGRHRAYRNGILLLLLLLLAVGICFFVFSRQVFTVTDRTARLRLSESAINNATTLKANFEKDLDFLSSVSLRLTDFPDLTAPETRDIVLRLSRYTSFLRLRVDLPNGAGYASDNAKMSDLDLEYLDQVLAGTTPSSIVYTESQGTPSLSAFVPIYDSARQVIAAVRGDYSSQKLLDSVQFSVFEGAGTFLLIDSAGNFLSDGPASLIPSGPHNLFLALESAVLMDNTTIQDIKTDFTQKRAGFLLYESNFQTIRGYYAPLGLGDWYVMSIAPIPVMEAEKTAIQQAAVLLLLAVFVLFLLIVLYIIYQGRKINNGIQRERTYLQQILDNIPIPVLIVDKQKQLEFVNRSACTLFGGTTDSLIGQHCSTLHSGDCNTPECAVHWLSDEGSGTRYLSIGSHSYQANSATLSNQRGCFIKALQDITEIADVRASLEERTAELEIITENIAGGVLLCSLEGDAPLIRCNRAYSEMLGIPASELIGLTAMAFIHPTDRPRVLTEIVAQLLQGAEVISEYRLIDHEGQTIWVKLHGRQAMLDGRPIGIWLLTDISSIKETEERLRVSEELYRIAAQNTEDTIIDYDIPKRCMRHTSKATEIYGVPSILPNAPEVLVETGVIHPDSAKGYLALFRELEAGAAKASYIIRALALDGRVIYNRLSFTTIFDSEHRPVRAIGILQDVTLEQEASRNYRNEQKYRDIALRDTLLSYEVNLTKKMFLNGHEEFASSFLTPDRNDYDAISAVLLEQLVVPEDREMVRREIDRQQLMEMFSRGENKKEFVYRRIQKDAEPMWVRSTTHLFLDEESGDLCGWCYIRDINQEKRQELALLEQAERDLLTGTFNKMTSESKVRQFVLGSSSGGAFLLVDLDDFKRINDTLGHAFGDAVLSEVARHLLEMFPEPNIVGRIGGDEFLVFLEDCPGEDDAIQSAGQICWMFHRAYTGQNNSYKVSGSIGIALCPLHGSTFEALYQNADIALYAAKRRGKDTYALFQPGMHPPGPSAQSDREIDPNAGKVFSKNIVEFVLRILNEATEPQLAISAVLELVAKHFGYTRSYVFQEDAPGGFWSGTYEWSGRGLTPRRDGLQHLPKELLCGDVTRFENDGLFWMNEESLPHVRSRPAQFGILAMVNCAIQKNGRLCGYIGFDTEASGHIQSEDELSTLRFVCTLLGSFILNNSFQTVEETSTEELEQVMDTMENFIYVVDAKSYQVQFMNLTTREAFPLVRPGDICYSHFRDSGSPCEDCPMVGLAQSGEVRFRKKVYNEMLDQYIDATASHIVWGSTPDCCLLNCIPLQDAPLHQPFDVQ